MCLDCSQFVTVCLSLLHSCILFESNLFLLHRKYLKLLEHPKAMDAVKFTKLLIFFEGQELRFFSSGLYKRHSQVFCTQFSVQVIVS